EPGRTACHAVVTHAREGCGPPRFCEPGLNEVRNTSMNFTLHVWRQKDRRSPGRMETYAARDISPDMSFLEMLDVVNEGLIKDGKEPIAFDHDCREGICGTCSLMINGL